MTLNAAQQQLALERFLASQPDLGEEIQALSPDEQAQQIQWAFENHAEDMGMEPWQLTLELIAESPEQLREMTLAVHREVAEALGMSWEEYEALNELQTTPNLR